MKDGRQLKKAVVISLLFAAFGPIISMLLVIFVYYISLLIRGFSKESMMEIFGSLQTSSPVVVVYLVVLSVVLMFSGYICSKIAKTKSYIQPTITIVLSFIGFNFTLGLILVTRDRVIISLIIVAMIYLGSYIYSKINA